MDNQAVTPTRFEFSKFLRDVKQEKPKFSQKEQDIATIADTDAWVHLKDFMLRRKQRLMELKDFDVNGADYEELGKLFYFARLVGDEIDAIIRMVEDTKRTVDGL